MSTKQRVYLCYWDCTGFEAIVDCTQWERESFLNTIAGKDLTPAPVNLQAMMLRARYNPQRGPEIWTFSTTNDITEDVLKDFAEDDPQGLVDAIRANGKCVYSAVPDKRVIQ